MGFAIDRDADDPFYLDPIEEERHRPAGESKHGVAMFRHPLILLQLTPELHALFTELADTELGTVESSLPADAIDRRSNAEVSLIHAWRAAISRRRVRAMRRN